MARTVATLIRLLLPLLPQFLTPAAAATAEAEQMVEFKALCAVAKLLEVPVPLTAEDVSVDADVDEILKLNMTAAPATWRTYFGDGSETYGWDKMKDKITKPKDATHWQDNWQRWLDTAKMLKPNPDNKQWLEDHPPPPNQKVAAAQLTVIAQKAIELQSKYKTDFANKIKAKESEAQTAMIQALTASAQRTQKTFDAFAAANQQERTDGDCSGDKAGQGVLYDLACLCLAATTANSKYCVGQPTTAAWEGTAGKLKQGMDELKKHCSQGLTVKPSAHSLTTAAAAVEQLIGRFGKATVLGDKLGKSDTAACSGEADKVCVKYDEYYSSAAASTKNKKIPWLVQVEKAAAALQTADAAKTEALATANSIANLKAGAEAVYAAAQISPPNAANNGETPAPNKATVDCTNIKTNTTCREKGCKWEGKTEADSPCVVDGSQPAATGKKANEGAAGTATTSGCARH
uniref:Variant surface glycoprotein 1125.1688 n=1 Tax=Trypanosoma brucei TaxID=5691 RepID=M4SUU0_9TRYP|nr:variant surface glycoprotein 1200 [Trypanosoma brucei]APD73842.1 variant surface glycoprotein 1125.1688 [Trypanosoma brucei]